MQFKTADVRGIRIVAPDYPGMGLSEAAPETVLRPTLDDLTAVMDAFIAQCARGPLILYLQISVVRSACGSRRRPNSPDSGRRDGVRHVCEETCRVRRWRTARSEPVSPAFQGHLAPRRLSSGRDSSPPPYAYAFSIPAIESSCRDCS